ncbi:MAG: hypothetical protein AB1511_11725 [Deinococcota bacterium]
MKNALIGFLALSAVSTASAASVGAYFGTDATGVYYQTDRTATSNLRYGANVYNLFRGGTLSLGGEVAYLNNLNVPTIAAGLDPYYGLGLGASISIGANLGVAAYPHGLLGLRYNVSGPFTVFGEVNAGPTLALGTGNLGLGFGFGARLGLDYQLR